MGTKPVFQFGSGTAADVISSLDGSTLHFKVNGVAYGVRIPVNSLDLYDGRYTDHDTGWSN